MVSAVGTATNTSSAEFRETRPSSTLWDENPKLRIVGLTLPHPKPEMPKPFNDVMSVLVVGF
jgi:hypothetical protein